MMTEFDKRKNTLGRTELPTSSGRCEASLAGSGTVLRDVGCCIDTRRPENGIRALNSTKRLNDVTGELHRCCSVVVADVVDELVDVVTRGVDGGIGFLTDDVDGESFDGGKPLAESTPKDKKKKNCVAWSDKEKEWCYECYLFTYKPGHRTGHMDAMYDLFKVRMGTDGYRDRSMMSMWNQRKRIVDGDGLLRIRMDEIRQRVKAEQLEMQGETWVDAAAILGDEGPDGGRASEIEDKEIDFSVDERGVIKTRAGRRESKGTLKGPKLITTPSVEVPKAVPGPQDERDDQVERKEQDFVFDGQKLDIKPSVVIDGARVDT